MVSQKVVVQNRSGFHVRPASILAKEAENCTSKIEIIYKNNIINAKSLLNIVSMAITKGAEVELRCTGADEEKDLKQMISVIEALDE